MWEGLWPDSMLVAVKVIRPGGWGPPGAWGSGGGQREHKYVGLWDFEARTAQELSFRAGDLFHVARKEEEWWWTVLLDRVGRALAKETVGLEP